jgi:glycosyltransferase involved in cell wall biosynthesis
VRFHGFRSDVRPLLAAADVFVSASKVECHPVAVLEAMAVGLPCLLSDIPPHRALADMGNLLFKLTDDSLMRRIEEVDRERSRLPVMGLAARQSVVRHFSIEAMLRSYFSLYAQV